MENYVNYISDTIQVLIENINHLISEEKRDDFTLGQLTAYYDVLTIFKEQAISFGIDIKEIGLDQIDENAVLSGKKSYR